MSKTEPKIEKGSEDEGTGKFRRRQDNSRIFIRKKKNPVGICEDIKNEVFDLLHQKQTDLFTNSLKGFYYICGINFQRNRRYVKYAINNPSNITLYAKTEPSFEAGKTALSIVQKVILDAKINKFVDRE